jgi:GNAT superfamily N-acetyltransferase
MAPERSVSVRPVEAEELQEVLPLIAGYQRFYGAEPDDDRNRAFFSRFVAPSEAGLLLGAWTGDAVAGFACIYWTQSSVQAADIALLNDLFVDERYRGHRIGRALIDAAAAAARAHGARHLEWLTAPDNAMAQRLYDRTGAERSTWIVYELPLGE